MIGIIGGTGFYSPEFFKDTREHIERTRFGEVKILIGRSEGNDLAFIPRHGAMHSIPPHLINYRANVKALAQAGVDCIIATSAVGSLNPGLRPGSFVLPDQFLDFTKSRISTFFEGESGVLHCDMTVPYCPLLREALLQSAVDRNLEISNGATYVCTEGPRFETTAEIKMFRLMGGDVVGMTSVPEVVLARELGICYASVGIVTNFAAGISPGELNHSEVVDMMKKSVENVRNIIMGGLEHIREQRSCACDSIRRESPMSGH